MPGIGESFAVHTSICTIASAFSQRSNRCCFQHKWLLHQNLSFGERYNNGSDIEYNSVKSLNARLRPPPHSTGTAWWWGRFFITPFVRMLDVRIRLPFPPFLSRTLGFLPQITRMMSQWKIVLCWCFWDCRQIEERRLLIEVVFKEYYSRQMHQFVDSMYNIRMIISWYCWHYWITIFLNKADSWGSHVDQRPLSITYESPLNHSSLFMNCADESPHVS